MNEKDNDIYQNNYFKKKKGLFNDLVIFILIGNKFKIYNFENENLNFMKFCFARGIVIGIIKLKNNNFVMKNPLNLFYISLLNLKI